MKNFLIILFTFVISGISYVVLSSCQSKPFSKASVNPKLTLEIIYDTLSLIKGKQFIVYKKNNQLTWRDFQGKVNTQSQAAALSSVGIKYAADMISSDDNLVVKVRLASYFDRKKSWYRRNAANNYILSHEQKHFDIARIGAYIVKQEIQKMQYTKDNVMEQLDIAYNNGWKKYADLQKEYDKATNHSIIKSEQLIWNAKIDSMLTIAYTN